MTTCAMASGVCWPGDVVVEMIGRCVPVTDAFGLCGLKSTEADCWCVIVLQIFSGAPLINNPQVLSQIVFVGKLKCYEKAFKSSYCIFSCNFPDSVRNCRDRLCALPLSFHC